MSGSHTDSSQNFRSNYYHKLGSTSAVDEKKNLKKLLSATPLDLKKLRQYCQYLHLPSEFRCELWKILLEISPIYQSTVKYVAEHRLEHFQKLEHVVKLLRLSSMDNATDSLNIYVAMYLIENRVFSFNSESLFTHDEAKIFYDVITAVHRMDFIPCDTYWLSRNFTDLLRQRVQPDISSLVDRACLQLDYEDGKLCEHLMKVGAYHNIPYSKWFSNCFADVLPETTFVRVWDKVMSGSTMVLVYIAVFTIIINRRPILVMKTTSKILEIFTQIKTDTADEIVRRGIELWQRNGGKLTPSNMRASPAVGTDRSPTPTLFYSSNA